MFKINSSINKECIARLIIVSEMKKLTGAKIKSNTAKELVAGNSIVIPDCELETALGELLQTDIFINKRVIPHGRAARSAYHTCLLFAGTSLVWQKITKK